MGLIAQPLPRPVPIRDTGIQLLAPRAAERGLPVYTHFDGDAVAGAGGEAGGVGVLVGEAEVVEDVGGVEVGVVVFELEVVGFGVVLGDGRRLGAEAEGAREVVAGVGGGGAAGEALDFA